MMRVLMLTVAVCCVGVITGGCGRADVEKKDLLMEVVKSFDEMFDTPRTRGEELYTRYCSVCHGLSGEGDGFNAYSLNPKPRNFTDSSFVARLDNALVVETITKGGGAVGLSAKMPPWGNTLSREDIELVAGQVFRLSQASPDSL